MSLERNSDNGQKCLLSNKNQTCAPKQQTSTSKYVANCIRKDNKICYSDYQHLVVQDESHATDSKNQQDLLEDSIYSGESLYKNLEFDHCQNEAENEKCLTFWKSVIEKNLEPIKCTLLKPSSDIRSFQDSSDGNKPKQTKKKRRKEKSPPSSKQKVLEQSTDDEQTTKGDQKFMRIFNEIKKKRLDKLSLRVKQNCKTCELMNSMNKDVMYSGDQDLDREHHLDQLGSNLENSVSSTKDLTDTKSDPKPQDSTAKTSSTKALGKEKFTASIKEGSKTISDEKQQINKSITNIPSKTDVATNTGEHQATNPTCNCKTNVCECKHDLAAVLEKMGQGPCCCGFAQCSCRQNLHVCKELIVTESGPVQNISAVRTATTSEDDNFKEDNKKSEESKSKSSNSKLKMDNRPMVSEKSLVLIKAPSHREAKNYESSMKYTQENDDKSHVILLNKSLTRKPDSPSESNNNKIENVEETKARSASNQLKKETSRFKTELSPNFGTPLTSIISDNNESKNVTQKDNLRKDTSSTKISKTSEDKSEESSRICSRLPEDKKVNDGYNMWKDVQPGNMSPEKGSKTNACRSSTSLSGFIKVRCECGYPDCDCGEIEIRSDNKAKHSCLCGCGHSSCKCKSNKSIIDIMKKIEERPPCSKLRRSSTSVVKKGDDCKCNSRTSKDLIQTQSSKFKETSNKEHGPCSCGFEDCDCTESNQLKENSNKEHDSCICRFKDCDCTKCSQLKETSNKEHGPCNCGFKDCDCTDITSLRKVSMQNNSEHRMKLLAELGKKVKEAEIDYFKKTPVEEKFSSKGVQCVNINPLKAKERKYCLICGHYDCPCEISGLI